MTTQSSMPQKVSFVRAILNPPPTHTCDLVSVKYRRPPFMSRVKPTPAEGTKSNPSKRHRDRLNSELDRLASLLPFPEDVISSLDKLSILRLSVSFLRTKSFFSVALKKNQLSNGVKKSSDHSGGRVPEGELLLQALNGFVLVVTAEGIIFFCSHTIQDYLGFHQTDVMHQSVFELIHTEDQQEFRSNLHWALNPPAGLGPPTDPSPDGESVSTSSCLVSYNPDQLPPENSSFLERGFVCRFRCLLDNSSGFLALNIQGRLKFLHGQSRQQCDSEGSTPPQLALFAIATPLQPPAILEIRTRNMIFRTKHKLDFTPMACDAKGKIVLGYTEAELRVRGSGYQFIHAADMLYCAENHVRMIKTGESGLTVFRLLTKDNRWKWVQANARLVYKNGKPDYIIATQRPLVDEEGGEHLRKRSMHLPFTFATGEAMLYQTGYPLHGFPDSFQGKSKGSKSKKGKLDKSSSDDLDPKSLLGALMSQDESVYVCQPDTEPKMSYHSSLFSEQQGDGDGFGGLLGGDSWQIPSNGDAERCNSKASSYDPLLATLDSLSLDGDETCSNSELFSALENLGLNAEDLELLLLDERMIQVELGPNHIPTLNDLLTNNEILSYIHDSLESATEGGDRGGFGPQNTDSAQSVSQQPQTCPPPAVPPPLPITQLSQQMQQHISAGELVKTQPVIQSVSQPADAKVLTNGHWVVTTGNHHHPNNHTHHHPHTVLKASQLNGEHKHLNALLESSQQWQLQQDQHPLHLQSHQQLSSQSAPPPAFQSQLGLTTNRSYIPNGHAAFPPNVEVGHAGYNLSNALHVGAAALNGVTTPDVCHYQSRPYQLHQKHQQQVPPSCLPQSSALELEQLLGLSQPQHSLPSLEAYSMFNTTTQEPSHSKLENGCLLSATNAAYIRTCLMPNGNGVATGDIPDGLPALQDPQKSGFFL
ncbi:aryl hydrocarbon receptor-like isoform X2 [Epinephelus moara]|uniref:aryl hydrocarbon receptor-like isoform X2 n=1 Tax=Epinephelus moara TaxID=300413 RepID=UPI00214EB8B6|nr:aryl hydrocarbon receptor-like isoform X2 [Epinephelus moara]